MVKKAGLLIGILFLCTLAGAQQLKAGIIWPMVQLNATPLKQSVVLDNNLQDNRFFRVDQLRPAHAAQTDYPGLYLQWENRKNIFLRTELRFSSTKFYLGPLNVPDKSDTNFIGTTWLVNRPMITAECGYLMGHKKAWHPFVAAGVSVSVFRFFQRSIPTYGYNDYDATAYYNYFANDPWFLSLQFRFGVQRRAFTLSTSFKTSVTKVHPTDAIQKVVCWSFLEFGWNFYRSGFLGKKQYHGNDNAGNMDHQVEVGLKKKGASTGLRVPFFVFVMDRPYLDAWAGDNNNYLVSITQAPEQRFNAEIFGNSVKALNNKKTLYLKTGYGVNIMTLLYKNVLRKTSSTHGLPDTEDRNDLVVETGDKQQVYLSLFYSVKMGYRIRTGKKSFVYADAGLRCQLSLKRYKTPTPVPYIKKSLLWVHPEIGFQSGHKGIQVGALGVLGRPDAFHIYKQMSAIYIGIYHEIYSK